MTEEIRKKKLNSMWRKNGPRHEENVKVTHVRTGVMMGYEDFVQKYAREAAGWWHGARVYGGSRGESVS